jgi:2-polyprenyl-3-methyl-5-hydroxy-6-metoxy-1,4-benzoquinol methylase
MNDREHTQSFSSIYREAVREVIALLPPDLSGIAKHNVGWRTGKFDPCQYLLDSEVRYLRALQAINSEKAHTVLDVGGFLAAFPLALSRMGFSVAIAEKFGYYDHALDKVAEHLTSNGVRVIDADFTEAGGALPAAGTRFDAVTCMAVAEHLAHTPRFLLENIHSALRTEGTLVFEVPNLAYWPRRAAFFIKGSSVHSPIADVYHSAVPYTGHHREYTLSDARYVVRESGFTIISEQTFNYSINSTNPFNVLKYLPAFLLKEWAEVIMLSCRKAG